MIRYLSALVLSWSLWSPAQAADFVGSASCRACHMEAYEHWRNGPHARAHLSLSPAQAKDPKCVQCHAPDTLQGGDPGVSCESCHGAGEYYAAEYVMKDAELARATGLQMPQAADCLLCHDASSPSLQRFDPAKKMQEIDHWTKPRQQRDAPKSAAAKGCELPKRQSVAKVTRVATPKGTFLAKALMTVPSRPTAEGKKQRAKKIPEARHTVAQSEQVR